MTPTEQFAENEEREHAMLERIAAEHRGLLTSYDLQQACVELYPKMERVFTEVEERERQQAIDSEIEDLETRLKELKGEQDGNERTTRPPF